MTMTVMAPTAKCQDVQYVWAGGQHMLGDLV